MTYQDLLSFLRSIAPAHVEILQGDEDMVCAKDHEANSEVYIKYSGGLDFSLQGIRNGEKTDTKVYSFRNENEMANVIPAKILQLLDGERRI